MAKEFVRTGATVVAGGGTAATRADTVTVRLQPGPRRVMSGQVTRLRVRSHRAPHQVQFTARGRLLPEVVHGASLAEAAIVPLPLTADAADR